jgi:hypothetical protein
MIVLICDIRMVLQCLAWLRIVCSIAIAYFASNCVWRMVSVVACHGLPHADAYYELIVLRNLLWSHGVEVYDYPLSTRTCLFVLPNYG